MPDKVRLMQTNWIGKSVGLQFSFKPVAPFDSWWRQAGE